MVKATVVSAVVLLLAITGCSEKTNPKIDSEIDADIKKMATQLLNRPEYFGDSLS